MHDQWLFIGNVIAHWVAAMSGIVSLSLGIVEYFRKQRTEGTILCVVAVLFLMVSFDQAWQDEHRNSTVLIAEKSVADSEREFWKIQSYEKDQSLRARDQLLSQNYSTLIGAQNSLIQLSSKILEIGKPTQLKLTDYFLGAIQGKGDNASLGRYRGSFIVLTNQMVTPVRLLVTCEAKINSIGEEVMGAGAMMSGGWGGRVTASDMQYGVGILSPAWTPVNPLMLTIHSDAPNLGRCTFEEK